MQIVLYAHFEHTVCNSKWSYWLYGKKGKNKCAIYLKHNFDLFSLCSCIYRNTYCMCDLVFLEFPMNWVENGDNLFMLCSNCFFFVVFSFISSSFASSLFYWFCCQQYRYSVQYFCFTLCNCFCGCGWWWWWRPYCISTKNK